jgi:hypothetical protein
MRIGMGAASVYLVAILALTGCKRTPDRLDAERAQCRALAEAKQLRAGLGIEECAVQLKAVADAADPAVRAGELMDRAQAIISESRGTGAFLQHREVSRILANLEEMGRPAVPAMLRRLSASRDPDLRIGIARVLVVLCSEDCGQRKWDCIVPAMLEGTTSDKAPEVRLSATRGLARCTQQPFGDDEAAFRRWYAEQAATASR